MTRLVWVTCHDAGAEEQRGGGQFKDGGLPTCGRLAERLIDVGIRKY